MNINDFKEQPGALGRRKEPTVGDAIKMLNKSKMGRKWQRLKESLPFRGGPKLSKKEAVDVLANAIGKNTNDVNNIFENKTKSLNVEHIKNGGKEEEKEIYEVYKLAKAIIKIDSKDFKEKAQEFIKKCDEIKLEFMDEAISESFGISYKSESEATKPDSPVTIADTKEGEVKKLKFANGNIWEGAIKDGKPYGRGFITYNEPNRPYGNYEVLQAEYKGNELTLKDMTGTNFYRGESEKGLPHGNGTMNIPFTKLGLNKNSLGDYYVGEFVNGEPHGEIEIKDKLGSSKATVTFENGKQV